MTVFTLPPKSERPICSIPGCGRTAQPSGTRGEIRWRRPKWMKEQFPESEGYACNKHHLMKHGIGGWDYKIYRKDYCENVDGRLGFACTTNIIDPEWQLDADHINGDPYSHRTMGADAIQTLCKCCHAIKTRDSRDYATAGRKTLSAA
tara:strand:+ start:4232 stop:4675 length:444 start_codon:yes stop_codon:yes gene_type:complete